MREWQSQTHVRWYCRYHIVIVPKYRKKAIYGVLHELCGQFGVELVEGHAMSDHIHLCLSIPPKLSVVHDRAVEREVGVENSPGFRQRTREFKGVSFLVDGVLCEYSRIG